ncbi:MAG: putative kinase [Candidatus Magasanikbacteria bacterium]|nr:putative kinase [Candidatus Magasanikbacteria bacterium]
MNLFVPDNFTNPEIKFTSVVGDARRELAEIFRKFFPAGEVQSIEELHGANINSQNYKITAVVDGEVRNYLLRRSQFLKDRSAVEFYFGVVEKLHSAGVPTSSAIMRGGQRSLQTTEALYLLFNFVEGAHFSPTLASYENIAAAVARMHLAFNALPPKIVDTVSEMSQKHLGAYFNVVRDYSAADFDDLEERLKASRDSDGDFILEQLPLVRAAANAADKSRPFFSDLHQQIVHSDLHPHNVLINNFTVSAILDFDSLRRSERGRDVAMCLYRFGRQFFVAGENPSKAPALAQKFLTAYGAVNSLSDREVELMPALLTDEFVRKLLFVLKGVYLDHNHAWAKDLPKFFAALQEIKFFWPSK